MAVLAPYWIFKFLAWQGKKKRSPISKMLSLFLFSFFNSCYTYICIFLFVFFSSYYIGMLYIHTYIYSSIIKIPGPFTVVCNLFAFFYYIKILLIFWHIVNKSVSPFTSNQEFIIRISNWFILWISTFYVYKFSLTKLIFFTILNIYSSSWIFYQCPFFVALKALK